MKHLRSTFRHYLALGILLGADFVFLSLALWSAYWLRFLSGWRIFVSATANAEAYLLAEAFATYFVMAHLAANRMYVFDRFRTWRDDAHAIIRGVSMAAILTLAITFFYRQIEFSRQMVLMAWPLAIVLLTLGRVLIRTVLIILRRQGLMLRRVMIVGQGAMADIFLERVKQHRGLGLEIMAQIAPNLQAFEERIKQDQLQVIFLTEENLPQEKILEMIEICEREGVELLLLPQVYDLLIGFSSLRDLHGLPLVELREEPLSMGTFFVKRIADFILALLLILITLPVQIIIAIWIRKDSPGPAVFQQVRVGYRGKRFKMFKFRSMVVDAEKKLSELVNIHKLDEPVFKFSDDPRVTSVGRVLRKTSLDELPQLFNVLLGHMSLVGPRPEEEVLVAKYNVWQRRRLKVKPGITGLQQIKCRGSQALSERVKYDILYIRKMSVLLDFEILVRTLWVVLSQKGAT